MKHTLPLLLLFFATLSFAQPSTETYQKEWIEVATFEGKGLPQTADSVTMSIYSMAKKAGNYPQYVKAVLHHAKHVVSRSEEGVVEGFLLLEKEGNESKNPIEKALIKSYSAEILWNYYTQQQWRINGRTTTTKFVKDDVRTWSADDFANATRKLYMESLDDEEALQAEPIKNLTAILTMTPEEEALRRRPSVFDLLAQRAMVFLMNDNAYITKPAYQFQVNDERYFGSSEAFLNMPIKSPDTSSYKMYAMKLLQRLTAFHFIKKNDYALAELDLMRLNWAKSNYFSPSKTEALYLKGLQNLYKANENKPTSILIAISLATALANQPVDLDDDQPNGKHKNQYAIKDACAFLKKALEKNPNAFESPSAYNIVCQWESKSVSMQIAETQSIDKPILLKIDYKNTNVVYIRAVKLDDKAKDKIFVEFPKRWNTDQRYGSMEYYYSYDSMLLNLPVVRTWNYTWTMTDDLRNHGFEQKTDGLPAGEYLFLLSMNPDFKPSADNMLSVAHTEVTELSFMKRGNPLKKTNQLYVFNAQTGQPLAGVSVEVCNVENSPVRAHIRRSVKPKTEHRYVTDKNGEVEIPYLIEYDSDLHYKKVNNNQPDDIYVADSYYLKLSTKTDKYDSKSGMANAQNYYYEYGKTEFYPSAGSQLFADRAIYRPGQTLYFKGIVFDKKEKANTVIPNTPVSVTLTNVNGQVVGTKEFTTNEYGSYQGDFTLPNNGLTGTFTLRDSYSGYLTFQMEEYKRPKFEVTFDTLKGSFKIGENIKVTGIAKNYAGNTVQDAEVKYRVVRTANFPYWYCWYWWRSVPRVDEKEIAHGTLKTKADGTFDVEFEALADSSVNASYSPQYNYRITADVVDLSGETRSATINARAGYIDIYVSLDLPEEVDFSQEYGVYPITSTNNNDIFTPARGTITAYKLDPLKTFIQPRAWNMPDEFVLNESEFKAAFPHNAYKNEQDYRARKRLGIAFSKGFNTTADKKMDFKSDMQKLEAGYYVVEIKTQDAFGTPLTQTQFFSIKNSAKNLLPNPVVLFANVDKAEGRKGEKSKISFGTTENIWVLVEQSNGKNEPTAQWFNLKNEVKIKEYLHSIKMIDNARVLFTAHYLGNSFTQDINLSTDNRPELDNDLKLEFSTFRNKLLPGQKESWRVKVTGKNNTAAASELLATMYDGSLDAFASRSWGLTKFEHWTGQDYYDLYYNQYQLNWQEDNNQYTYGYNYSTNGSGTLYVRTPYSVCSKTPLYFQYPFLNNFGVSGFYYNYYDNDYDVVRNAVDREAYSPPGYPENKQYLQFATPSTVATDDAKAVLSFSGDQFLELSAANGETMAWNAPPPPPAPAPPVQVRKNFNETAFFLPQLVTNEKGEVMIEFTVPESLTKWHFTALAHTKDMKSGVLDKNDIVTQKDLMIFPNMPRFLREGDKITLATKVSNLSDKLLNGSAKLMLFDAFSMKPIDADFKNTNNEKAFECKPKGSAQVSFDIEVPFGAQAVVYRIIAQSGTFSDGEENALPVLTNRMLVTETLPLPVRGGTTKSYSMEKLKNTKSSTLKNHSLTLEITSNPVWYAIQALPYLMEYPYECAEQTFSRLYANSLAKQIANSNPKIKEIFESWKNTPAILSNLEKNQELKNIVLEETPWVRDAQNESERKKRIGILFDLQLMDAQYETAVAKLIDMQLPIGGFVWFKGDNRPDRYITQHIICGFGKLDHLHIDNVRQDQRLWQSIYKGISYLDGKLVEDYNELVKYKMNNDSLQRFSSIHAHYFYMRSFFKDIPIPESAKVAFNFYKGNIEKYWLNQSNYEKGLCALGLFRFGSTETPKAILKSLKEFSLNKEELGMYWANRWGYYWYEAPIETQALMIEAFEEITKDEKAVDDMRTWLIKQKQTQDWKTTRATVEAIYALLLRGTDYVGETQPLQVTLGGEKIQNTEKNSEPGTGYYKQTWNAEDVKPNMADVTLTNPNKVVAWGALYWQYFEDLDKITPADTPLKLSKQLFLQNNTDKGLVMEPITDKTTLKVGDLVKVRVELRVDRDMEYIHLKDMRASGFEPINVISQYKWQDGLGYYESTRDAATNFFFNYLPKGTYVFEYPLRVAQQGDMSNGISQIQCMYAPEFSAHSEGTRVKCKM